MPIEIVAFVNFRSLPSADWASAQMSSDDRGDNQHRPGAFLEKTALFPSESDLLLSALQPFHDSKDVRIKVYDLSTTLGRLQGLLHNVSEAPAVIIEGERFIGWEAARLALCRLQEEAV